MGFQNYFQSVISYKVIAEHFIAHIDQTPYPSLLTLMEESDPSNLSKGSFNTLKEFYQPLADHLRLRFTSNPEGDLEERASPVCYAQSSELREGFEMEIPKTTFASIDFLDYVYAVFHSPVYRQKYKEFLEVDFPQMPYPNDQNTFWKLIKLGGKIRRIHRLESSTASKYITTYPIGGSNSVTPSLGKDRWELNDIENQHGRIWINEQQYFDKVPLAAWEFYMGDYPPAQQWLKNRKGQKLSADDILHYQKIIVALAETNRLMKAIGEITLE